VAAILAGALLAGACAGGPAGPTGGASGGAPRAAAQELPPPSRETLPNGLKLIVQEHSAADIVAVYMWIAAGVRDEAPDSLGYSHFQEHMLLEAKDLAAVEQAILAELRRIQEQGVTEDERQLAVTRAEKQYAFDRETSEGLAFAFGLAELTWSLEEELRYIDTLRKVSREQIQEAARRWLSTENYVRIGFAPRKAAAR
jgi:predicted Zn-dependent peptidase